MTHADDAFGRDPRIDRLLRGSNRLSFTGSHRVYLGSTLLWLSRAWPEMPGGPPPTQPTATLDDLLALDAGYPGYVDCLMHSIALLVSMPMLVMQLLVMRGGRVVDIDFGWHRGEHVRLRFVVRGVDGVERTFESDNADDFSVLHATVFSGLRADDADDDELIGQGVFGGFRKMTIALD